MKLLAAVLAVTVLVVTCEAGSKCVWGPSYWCQNAATAEECGEHTYCQDNVWKTEAEVGDGLECGMCELLMKEVDKFIAKNNTEIEVKVEIEKFCALLGPLANDCKSLIESDFDVIWKLLRNETDPVKVCTEIGVCTNSAMSVQHEKVVKADPPQCTLCDMVIHYLEEFVDKNGSEAKVEHAIENICKILPGAASTECTEFVEKNFDSIWQLFKNDSKDICKLFNCSKTGFFPRQTPSLVKVGDACSTCKLIVSFLAHYVDSNSTEQEVENALESLCKLLPSSLSGDCTELIDEYFNIIWALVKGEFDNDEICKQLKGICPSASSEYQLMMQVKVPIVRADSCSLCKLVASYLQHFVDGSNSEEEVKSYVEALCKLLPGNTSTECTQLVDKYFDSIWEELKTELDSGKVCQDIGLCNSTLAQPPVKALVKAPTAPADLCSTCKLVASFLKHFVDSNSSEAEVKGALEAFCKLLPGNVSTECKDLVDKSFDTIWILLKAEVDSGKICEQIGLCNSTLSRPVSKAPLQSSDEECEICKMVMLYLDEVVDKNSTEGEVKDALEKVCSLIQSNECKTVIDKYFDMIWQMVKTEADSGKVCEMIGVCKDSTFRRQPVKAPVGGVSCSLCDLAVKFLKPFVDSNITETEAKDSLEKLCGYLKPALLEDECTQLIDDDFPMIWKLLQSYVDDAQICKEIGLCSSFVATIQSKAPDASVECVLCEFVMKEVDNLIGNNKTTAAVEAALKKVCDVLPATIKDLCDSFVDKYAPTIIQLIEEELTPDQICTKLGLCNSTVSVRILVTTPKASVECILCEFVLKEVDSIIGTNESEAVVKAAVEKVCSILPTTIETECKKLVDEYADQIIDMIMNGLNPDEVCSAIGLCKSTTRVKVTSPKASVQCILCEFVMKEVDTILNGSTTEAAVEAALEKVCDVLPTTIKAECDALVKQYTPEIVKLIINGLSPSEVCTMLGLCKSTTSVGVASPMISVECVMCEFVMKEVDSMLMKNSTEKDIEGVLEKICNYLPATVQKDCVSFIDLYTPKLLDALVKELDPKDVCTALNLCSNSSLTVAPKSPKAGPLCVVCEFVLEKLAGLVNKTSTKTEIKAALDEVCSLLPKTIESECVDFVNKSADEIVELLFDGVAPKVVCSLLHLCLLSDQSRPTAVNTPKLDECAVCKFTIQSIKTLIDSKAAQSTVEEALEKACGLLPKEISGECESLVEKYDPQIIQLLDQEIKPEAFCEDVKLCKKTRKATNVLMQPWLKMARIREL